MAKKKIVTLKNRNRTHPNIKLLQEAIVSLCMLMIIRVMEIGISMNLILSVHTLKSGKFKFYKSVNNANMEDGNKKPTIIESLVDVYMNNLQILNMSSNRILSI